MGCAATHPSHPSTVPGSQPGAASAAQAHHRADPRYAGPAGAAPRQQQPGPAPQQQAPPQQESRLKTAPVVKSMVSLQRDKCSLERDSGGCHLAFSGSALAAGEATAFFLAGGGEETGRCALERLEAKQVSTSRFSQGQAFSCRLFLCADLESSLEGFKEGAGKHMVVLDLRVDADDASKITAQRSFLKLGEGSSVQVLKQMVQCGPVVRQFEALYGTLPNPRTGLRPSTSGSLAGPAGGGDQDGGGDCVICLSKPKQVAILHCRHVCLCRDCAKITSSTWSFQCPVCRGRVAAMVGVDGSPDAN